jgi:hypothetical protein
VPRCQDLFHSLGVPCDSALDRLLTHDLRVSHAPRVNPRGAHEFQDARTVRPLASGSPGVLAAVNNAQATRQAAPAVHCILSADRGSATRRRGTAPLALVPVRSKPPGGACYILVCARHGKRGALPDAPARNLALLPLQLRPGCDGRGIDCPAADASYGTLGQGDDVQQGRSHTLRPAFRQVDSGRILLLGHAASRVTQIQHNSLHGK